MHVFFVLKGENKLLILIYKKMKFLQNGENIYTFFTIINYLFILFVKQRDLLH